MFQNSQNMHGNVYDNLCSITVNIDTPANEFVAGGFGQNSGGSHASIAELQLFHYVRALFKRHIHPTGDNGDVILPTGRLLEGREVLALQHIKCRQRGSHYCRHTVQYLATSVRSRFYLGLPLQTSLELCTERTSKYHIKYNM